MSQEKQQNNGNRIVEFQIISVVSKQITGSSSWVYLIKERSQIRQLIIMNSLSRKLFLTALFFWETLIPDVQSSYEI